MKSHTYHLTRADWMDIFMPPLAVFVSIVLLMHLLRASGRLPDVLPSDVDAMILTNKAEAIQSGRSAELILVGDSSCLMDVSAKLLERQVALQTYNLGTMRTLGLEKFGAFTSDYIKTDGDQVKAIVLLLGPEMIAQGGAAVNVEVKMYVPEDPEMRQRLRLLQEEGSKISKTVYLDPWNSLLSALALPFIRTQIVNLVFERPLKAGYGFQYGTPSEFRTYLNEENGSAIDPSRFEPGEAGGETNGYEMDVEIKGRCEAFRAKVPETVRLFVGITPVPESNPTREYVLRKDEVQAKLAEYLRGETLAELPAVLPDQYFATVTHLNERGQRLFTRMLGRSLTRRLNAE